MMARMFFQTAVFIDKFFSSAGINSMTKGVPGSNLVSLPNNIEGKITEC